MSIKTYSVSKDGEKFLSPHFQVKEFRPKWNGKPDGDIVKISDELIEKLELLSDCVNNKAIHISDGYRTEAFDKYLTGKCGQHTTGKACDCYVTGYTAKDLLVLAEACGFTGLGTVSGNVVHLDVREGKQVFFAENGTKAGTESIVSDWLKYCSWLHFVKIPYKDIASIEFVETREPVKTTATKFNDVDYIINGGFWGTYRNAVFNYRANGITRATYSDHKWGMAIHNGNELRYKQIAVTDTDFISGHPILLDGGKFCSYEYAKEIDGERQRTAIGYNSDSIIILVSDLHNGNGLTLRGLRQVMKYIGCDYAINLDGGGSSSLFSKGKCLNTQTDQRSVNNVIMIRKR